MCAGGIFQDILFNEKWKNILFISKTIAAQILNFWSFFLINLIGSNFVVLYTEDFPNVYGVFGDADDDWDAFAAADPRKNYLNQLNVVLYT